jgi:hypothetical protein
MELQTLDHFRENENFRVTIEDQKVRLIDSKVRLEDK